MDLVQRKLTLVVSGRSRNADRQPKYLRLSSKTIERLEKEVSGPGYLAVEFLINFGLDALAESFDLPVTVDAKTIDGIGETSPPEKRGQA